jgi:hypothetical protein
MRYYRAVGIYPDFRAVGIYRAVGVLSSHAHGEP